MSSIASKQVSLKWVYGAGLGFVLLNAFFIYMEVFWLAAIPAALFIIGLALFRIDVLLMIITFAAPISLNIEDVGGGFGLSVPTDPLMFGAMVVFLFRTFYDLKYDFRILKHPITVSILVYLVWIAFTSITSELPLVSWKFLLSKMWYMIPFYFIAVQMFKYPDKVSKYFWLYVIPMTGVIIYTLARHGARGFGDEAAHWVMQPFFKDHTSYGAILAMYIPVILAYTLYDKWDINARILAGFFLTVFLVGVVMSYTRAAWVGLVGALGLLALIVFKVRWWVVGTFALLGVAGFFAFQTEIMHKLEKNRQDSSSDLAEHVESISNVATDASNLERLNRWNAAFSMFFESPVVGKGPGTYSFLYAPYQKSADLTIISTNFGDGGNAHSEYFGPLAEQGVPGMLTFIVIVFFVYFRGIPLYYKLNQPSQRKVLMAVLLGLTTYFIHGMLNNFLDIDKVNVAFWGFIAVITALDVYGEKKENPETEIQLPDSKNSN